MSCLSISLPVSRAHREHPEIDPYLYGYKAFERGGLMEAPFRGRGEEIMDYRRLWILGWQDAKANFIQSKESERIIKAVAKKNIQRHQT